MSALPLPASPSTPVTYLLKLGWPGVCEFGAALVLGSDPGPDGALSDAATAAIRSHCSLPDSSISVSLLVYHDKRARDGSRDGQVEGIATS